jgi:hypothetical protein
LVIARCLHLRPPLIPTAPAARPYGVKLLVLNCHEAWVHQLGALGADLDIVTGLPGRYTTDWDARMRPLPARARTLSLDDARASGDRYDCVVNPGRADGAAGGRV